jgi:hypothetical protein
MDMNNFDPSVAAKIALDSHIISPHDAEVLQRRCSQNNGDWEAHWKLLGFYYAHHLCCPQYTSRRIENIIWIIDNVPQLPRVTRSLLFAGPGDRPYVPRIRAAWQRRIDDAPDDPVFYQNMGDFLQGINPGEACSYYEKALSLGGDKAIETQLTTARILEKHAGDATTEDYGEPTCFFDVVRAGDRLLHETRNRMHPDETDWNRFFDIAHELIRDPMFLVFAHLARRREVPVDAPASKICKSALSQMYHMFDAKSEVGRALRKPRLKALWKDLVTP